LTHPQQYGHPHGGQHHAPQYAAPQYAPPQYAPAGHSPVTPEPPKKKRTGLKIFGGIVGGLILLGIIGNAMGGGNNRSATPTTNTAPVAQAPAATQAAEVQSAPASGPDLSQGIPDGQYIVGDEVAPGRYKSVGAQAGIFELCSVSTKDKNGNVLDWKTGNEGDQVLITITEKADTVEIQGCEPFRKVS